MLPDDPDRFDTDAMTKRIRTTLDIPDLEIDLRSISHWYVSSVVTEHFRSQGGNIFLLGDAAHRIPPWGALGLNTGIQDAFNLIWKLAFALRGHVKDPDFLLNTYEQERRPIALRVAQSSLFNLRSHGGAMDRALGISPDQSREKNQAAMDAYFDVNHPYYQQKQEDVKKAQQILDGEFCAHGTEVGWFYPSADPNDAGKETRHGGQLREDGKFDNITYHPSSIPGHHLPHAWLERGDERISTRDLLIPDTFLLWAQAVGAWDYLEKQSEVVKLETIGSHGVWSDPTGSWERQCGVSQHGAILVRPDGIVAWRGETEDEELRRFLAQCS